MKTALRRILSLIVLATIASAPLLAQQKPQQPSDPAVEVEKLRIQAEERARAEEDRRNWETRVFPVRYVDPNDIWQVLSMFRAESRPNPSLRVISVRAPKEILPAIEDAIKRLDVPTPAASKNADLTVYILMATDQAAQDNIPKDLQPVVTQLRGILTYKSYQLVETLLARGSDGRRIGLNGALQGVRSGAVEATNYGLQGLFRIDTRDGKTSVLQIREMHFTLGSVGINTDVEIPQGQQIVVGKATMGDRAFILVMSAKFSN